MTKTRSGSVTQDIYEQIKAMIFEYRIVPGQRLVFKDLAKKLEVSRTPVNNALSLLANDGFLDLIPKEGYRVRELTQKEADDLIELRLNLELIFVGKIIKNIDEKEIEILEQRKESYEEAALKSVSRETFFLNEDFHASYLETAGNNYLVNYYREINQRVFLHQRIDGYRLERTHEVLVEHNRIFDALCEHDLDKTKAAISDHVMAGKEYISTLFN